MSWSLVGPGSLSSTGLYRAPTSVGGTALVIASAGGVADTAVVRISAGGSIVGVPLGASHLFDANVPLGPFTWSVDGHRPDLILADLTAARARGVKLVMNMTGGSHNNYKTDGKFDEAKWRARMDGYNTPAIRDAVNRGIAEGWIMGASVMDEPHQSDAQTQFPEKSWGPEGWMTKAKVDRLCTYVKTIFPALPAGVAHDHRHFEPAENYAVCDFLITQYRISKGPVRDWKAGAVAFATRSGIGLYFGVNILHGGLGRSCSDPPCPMNATEVDTLGAYLAPGSCGISLWQYEATYWAKPEHQAAFRSLADKLAALTPPTHGCRRS